MKRPPDPEEAFERAGLIDVAYLVEDSPVGPLLLAATREGLACIDYLRGEHDLERRLGLLAQRYSPRVLRSPRRLDRPRRQLDEFFAGRRQSFELELDRGLVKPGFTSAVLDATLAIPFGHTISYKRLAGNAGNQRAFRAAGAALGSNPLPIVIPCHRVLHSDGGLGGYAGGLEIKRALLELEGVLEPAS